jgi:hypothetical protein
MRNFMVNQRNINLRDQRNAQLYHPCHEMQGEELYVRRQ